MSNKKKSKQSSEAKKFLKEYDNAMKPAYELTREHLQGICAKDLKEATGNGQSVLELAQQFINETVNANDPYGDGDQSDVLADFPGQPGQRLRDLWAVGGDFFTTIFNGTCPPFIFNCYHGQACHIQRAIDLTQPGSTDRTALLEQRISVLRMCPLLACIAGARRAQIVQMTAPGICEHFKTAQILCDAGARVNCKDVAGYSAVHHCTTNQATVESLAIFHLLVTKYEADVQVKNRFGATAILESCMNRRMDILEAFLASNYKPDSYLLNMTVLWPEAQAVISQAGLPHRRRLLKEGDYCKLVHLEKMKELNGMIGTLLEKDYQTGRWPIKLENDRIVRVKRHCLSYVGCEVCRQPSSKKCSRCQLVSYCSADCQKSHWSEHKLVCTQRTTGAEDTVVIENGAGVKDLPANLTSFNFTKMKTIDKTNGGPSKVTKGKRLADGSLSIVIKIQVPIKPASMTVSDTPGALFVYNEDRSFSAYIGHSEAQYGRVRDFILTHGVFGGVKIHMRAVYLEAHNACQLVLSPAKIESSIKW